LMSKIIFEVQEKGLLIDDLHIYEENKRICVEGYVYCKWNGGIPAKHYLAAVEKALKKPMRMGKEAKTILTQEPVFLSLYEDTKYYGLQGIATEKKRCAAFMSATPKEKSKNFIPIPALIPPWPKLLKKPSSLRVKGWKIGNKNHRRKTKRRCFFIFLKPDSKNIRQNEK